MKKNRFLYCLCVVILFISTVRAQNSQSPYFDDYLRRHGGIYYTQTPQLGIGTDLERGGITGDVRKVTEYRTVNSTTEKVFSMEFDDKGYILSETFTPRGTKELLTLHYSYDYQNNRLESITVARNGSSETYPVYHNNEGFISGATYEDGVIKKYAGERYKIDYGVFTGMPIDITGVAAKDEYYRYTKGLLSTEEYNSEISGIPSSVKVEYIYDMKKQPSGYTTYTYKRGTEEPLVVKSGSDTYTAKPTPVVYQLEYDSQNNWIKKTYSFGHIGNDTRTYEYNNSSSGATNTGGGKKEDPNMPVQTLDCEISLPQSAYKESVSSTPWNGHNSVSMPGQGTQDNPYLVTSAAQMACIAFWCNEGRSLKGKYFVLMTDLDLSSTRGVSQEEKNWKPIGTPEHPFEGKFYGNGHTVRNMSILEIDKKKPAYGGVFGYIAPESLVRDLKIDSSCKIKAQIVGGIAAVNNGTISYCNSSLDGDGTTIGSIVGENNNRVYGCISDAKINLLTDGGGIAGKSRGVVEKCVFRGTVTYFTLSHCAGGIVGELLSGGKITDCYHRGNVAANIIGIAGSAGGIAGNKNLPDGAEISNSYCAGKVKGGHLAGNLKQSLPKIANCWFDVDVKGLSKSEKKEESFYMNNGGLTSVQMKEAQFITTMNNGRDDGPWIEDTKRSNDGYPILKGIDQHRPVYICSPSQLRMSSGPNLFISKDGVGYMRFGDSNPELGPGYTVTKEKDPEWGETDIFCGRNAAGEIVVEYYPAYLMIVHGKEFQTRDEGVRVGMTLAEVRKLVTNYSLVLHAYANTGKLYIQFNDDMVFEIYGHHLKGGQAAYDKWYLHGTKLDISVVSEDAIIENIRVQKK